MNKMKTKSICIACGTHEPNKTFNFDFSMCPRCVKHLGVEETRRKELEKYNKLRKWEEKKEVDK